MSGDKDAVATDQFTALPELCIDVADMDGGMIVEIENGQTFGHSFALSPVLGLTCRASRTVKSLC